MDEIDRAKILLAATTLFEQEFANFEEKISGSLDKIDDKISDLQLRTTVATLVPLINNINGLDLTENEDGDLCIEFNGNSYPIRGAKGDEGTPGPVGPEGPAGPRGLDGPPGELSEADKKLLKKIDIKEPPTIPGNVMSDAAAKDDKLKEALDKELWKLKQEFESLKLGVDKTISSRMTMLAMLASGGGGGGGEVKISRMDDIDFGGGPDGGILEWDSPTNKFILGAHLRAQDITPANNAVSISYKDGAWLNINLDENITSFAASDWPDSGTVGRLTVIVNQGGGHTMTWPTGTIWPNGTPPTLSSSSGDIDVIVLTTMNSGNTIIGTVVGSDYS